MLRQKRALGCACSSEFTILYEYQADGHQQEEESEYGKRKQKKRHGVQNLDSRLVNQNLPKVTQKTIISPLKFVYEKAASNP